MTTHCFFRFAAGALLLAATSFAQDTSTTPFGGTAGTAFDVRAPADDRIQAVTVNSGTFLDGLRLFYEHRNGNVSGSSPQLGSTTGTATTFLVPDGEYLVRVQVWYDASAGYLRGIRLRTNGGTQQTFGLTTGSTMNVVAASGQEVVGLLGTGGGLMSSLGVTTRPVLASHVRYGVGCASNLGGMQIRYRPGNANLEVGGEAIVEVTNVPFVWGILAIGFTPIPTGVPLGAAAPGCSLYVTPDIVQLCGTEANHAAGYTVLVPNEPSLVGFELMFQGATFGAPNGLDLATSDAFRCMVGIL